MFNISELKKQLESLIQESTIVKKDKKAINQKKYLQHEIQRIYNKLYYLKNRKSIVHKKKVNYYNNIDKYKTRNSRYYINNKLKKSLDN